MYSVTKGIHIDFAHIVEGHPGACINLHGHTWMFEVCVRAQTLDETGFVVDFSLLKRAVLEPVHLLLDHSLALSGNTFDRMSSSLANIGRIAFDTRNNWDVHDDIGFKHRESGLSLNGARQVLAPQKVAVFPFSPTSERLAGWLFGVARATFPIAVDDPQSPCLVQVEYAKVYETLHPVESVATYYHPA